MTYYTYNSETKALTPAPTVIKTENAFIINPSAHQYATLLDPPAYSLVEDPPPTPPEGKITVQDGYQLIDNQWHPVWKYEDAPEPEPVIHTYRRSYIAQWIRMKGRWNDFKALLAKSDELAFMWETSTEFDSNHPMWNQALAGVKAAFNFTDKDIGSMLHYGETGKLD